MQVRRSNKGQGHKVT